MGLNIVILMVLTRILQTSISQSLSADNPEAPAIGYLCNCNCTRPKDILSIPHIRLLSKRGSSKKEESLEKQTEAPEIQLFLPANVQDHGDSFDSSFDDFDDTLSQVNLPVDDSGHVPLDGLDHSEYINDPLYVPMGSDNSQYVHDPLYENVQTRTDIGGVRVTNVHSEEPLYENIPNREDKLYELIDVDEEHIYHDEEVARYLRQREEAGAYDNVKKEDTTLYENFYKANHTDHGPNTSNRFGEMMQRDHSNPDENSSFHSIVSVPSAAAYPPPFMIDHKQDDTYVQEDPGHHNINKDFDVFRSSYESLVSSRQPKPPNTPSPSPPFTTPQQTPNPPSTSPTFRSHPLPEHDKLSFHSSSQNEQQYQPLYQQTHFTDVRLKEGQQQLPPPPPPPPRPPPPPPPPPSWIAKSDVRGMSEHNPNKTKNATDNLRGLRRGSLFKVRTSTGSYLSMHIQDKVDN
ncbi:hypothetical protein CHS0354_032545 [Potamilus streckersoni]|uniref:Uncharacterized protein n=1 Tax=Potamilus streckersoni TaxID=2493646 RepID=A0AAE0SQ73_9BIVA|nr:hypothetical protein CHS0354_032545 [Potamilus streckersoni]